jgi:uncharacterized protein (TIGR02453 family)
MAQSMKNVMEFLQELDRNNHKEWMDANKNWYQEAKREFLGLVDEVIKGITAFDPGIAGITAKDCTFRINRDIRFSKDKRPYKNNFGAAIQEGGKKSPNPTYYLHLQPGESMIAGGCYMPAAAELAKIRQEIDYNPAELKEIVEKEEFKNTFGAVQGEALKTAPKGYPKDHPNIELLRLKSFVVMQKLPDSKVIQANFADKVISDFKILQPFNHYLGVAIS